MSGGVALFVSSSWMVGGDDWMFHSMDFSFFGGGGLPLFFCFFSLRVEEVVR